MNTITFLDIHSGDCSNCDRQDCDTSFSCRQTPTFRRNTLSPSSVMCVWWQNWYYMGILTISHLTHCLRLQGSHIQGEILTWLYGNLPVQLYQFVAYTPEPRSLRQHLPPKRLYPPTRLYGIKTQKTTIWQRTCNIHALRYSYVLRKASSTTLLRSLIARGGVRFVLLLARSGFQPGNALKWRINPSPNRIITTPWGPWKRRRHDLTSSN